MPLEGHWERQQTPLRLPSGRGGWVLLGAGAALVAAVAVLLIVVVFGGSDAKQRAPGCIEVTGPSTTGAATVHACGRTAERTCRAARHHTDTLSRAVSADCRRMRVREAGGR